MFDLEQKIIKWRKQMAASGIRKREALDELESHLRDDIDQQIRAGASEQEAFDSATKHLGQAGLLHSEYDKVKIVEPLNLHSRYLYPFGVGMAFLLAIFFLCHFLLLPAATQSNQRYFEWLGIHANTRTGLLLSCWWTLEIAAGLAMPLSLLLLAGSGRLNYQKVIRFRPGMMIINFFLAILLTSPEVLTQAIMFLTLQLLCEGCLLIAQFKNAREALNYGHPKVKAIMFHFPAVRRKSRTAHPGRNRHQSRSGKQLVMTTITRSKRTRHTWNENFETSL